MRGCSPNTLRLRRASGSEGAAIVEFAISASILFVLIIGIMYMCLALFAYEYVNEAARETARWAMVRGSQSCSNTPGLSKCGADQADIQDFVKGLGYPTIISSNITVTVTWLSASGTQPTTWSACGTGLACRAPGNAVQVTVKYVFPFITPFLSNAPPTLQSTSQVVVSQ